MYGISALMYGISAPKVPLERDSLATLLAICVYGYVRHSYGWHAAPNYTNLAPLRIG